MQADPNQAGLFQAEPSWLSFLSELSRAGISEKQADASEKRADYELKSIHYYYYELLHKFEILLMFLINEEVLEYHSLKSGRQVPLSQHPTT